MIWRKKEQFYDKFNWPHLVSLSARLSYTRPMAMIAIRFIYKKYIFNSINLLNVKVFYNNVKPQLLVSSAPLCRAAQFGLFDEKYK